jgi:hypothetical protein
MKRSAKPLTPQMNLPLLEPLATVPGGKQKEVALTLMEMLINAAVDKESVGQAKGGKNEPAQAHR